MESLVETSGGRLKTRLIFRFDSENALPTLPIVGYLDWLSFDIKESLQGFVQQFSPLSILPAGTRR